MNGFSIRVTSLLILALLCLSSCRMRQEGSSPKTLGVPTGQYRGWQRIDAVLASRLFKGEKILSRYFPNDDDGYNPNPTVGAEGYTGSFMGENLKSRYHSGVPSPMANLTWYVVFSSMSSELAMSCSDSYKTLKDKKVTFTKDFETAFAEFCQTGDPRRSDTVLENIWLAVMQYDAPRSEFEEWQIFVRKLPATNSQQKIREALLAMFLNPYFLLER